MKTTVKDPSFYLMLATTLVLLGTPIFFKIIGAKWEDIIVPLSIMIVILTWFWIAYFGE